jgi:hypothetical protein
LETETWELSIDEDEPIISHQFLDGYGLDTASSEMQEKEENRDKSQSRPSLIEIPDLPDVPKPVAHIVQMSNATWSPMLDEIEEGVPALPEFGLDLEEAPLAEKKQKRPSPAEAISSSPQQQSFKKIVTPHKPKTQDKLGEESPTSLSDLLSDFVTATSVEPEPEERDNGQ